MARNDRGWVLQTRSSNLYKWRTNWLHAGKTKKDVLMGLSWRQEGFLRNGSARITRCSVEEEA